MHILFLSRWQPFPPNNGSKQRIFNLIKILSSRHKVTLITFKEPGESSPQSLPDIPNLAEVKIIVRKPFDPTSLRARTGFFNVKPRFVIDTYSNEMADAIRTTTQKNPIDLVIASQFDMAIYWSVFEEIPAIFEEMEIGVFQQRIQEAQKPLQKLRDTLTWLKHRRYMHELLKFFTLSTVVSSQEAALTYQAFPDLKQKIKVLPNCVDLTDYQDFHQIPDPNRLIFTGSFSYQPNYEAMLWFVNHVFPSIFESHPKCQLVITGDPAGKEFPSHPNITQTGMVPDIRPWVSQAWISVAPLLTGGGTRLKILEAMGLQSAVVATSKGAEGLDFSPGEHLLIADAPEDFANAVCRLLDEPQLRANMVKNAYQSVTEKYDWAGQIQNILSIVDKIALN